MWVTNCYKSVFESKKGFAAYSRMDKEAKWGQPQIKEGYELYKRSNRGLVQSRNPLLHVYDMVMSLLPSCTAFKRAQ